ncbi:MAG: hypothetical protein ACKN9L_05890, partial [Actinomycetota bacterium]
MTIAKFRRMRRWICLLVLLVVTSGLTSASGASIAGSKCSKAGITKVVGTKKYTCIKSGKKLIWNNGIAIKQAAPQQPAPIPPLPSASPAPSPSPTSELPKPTNNPAEGLLCPTVGQLVTISGRDLICQSDASGKQLWKLRQDQTQPSPQPQ